MNRFQRAGGWCKPVAVDTESISEMAKEITLPGDSDTITKAEPEKRLIWVATREYSRPMDRDGSFFDWIRNGNCLKNVHLCFTARIL
jgi:hypothetical protein